MTDLSASLGYISDNLQYWLDWNAKNHRADGREPEDDMHIINGCGPNSPPTWPSRGTLARWITVLREAESALRKRPEGV